jgi:alkylation response protein AidB-like acyl-CoA dehydrogenase
MLLELSSDQEFFRDTTAKFLREQVPVGEIRRLRDEPDGFDEDYWRRGAELGWTSLLVGEEHGGGSISGNGLGDLTLVAHEFGRHAAPGPLVATNVVAAALSNAATGSNDDLLAGLLAGTSIASWCTREPRPNDRLGQITTQIRVDGDEVVVTGAKRPVESADRAGHLLVTGAADGGTTQVLVPTATPGVTVTPMHTVDLTRRFSTVTFDDVRLPIDAVVGELGGAGDQVEHQLQLAIVIANAESVGAMQIALDMTVEWAFDRYSFGRPLASYQELKHRFADMKTWLEASHAIADAATAAVAERTGDAAELVSAAKAYIGDHGSELMQDCVQIHGGIGLTFEHDLHLYLRRQTVDRALYGTPAEHRARLTDILEREVAA